MFAQINFVAVRRGAVREHYFYNKLGTFNVKNIDKAQDSGGACVTHMQSA